jgi:DedD protein
VVLTALAIIILPMLLDGSADDRARVVADIPAPPRIELKTLSVAEISRKAARMEAESTARLPQTATGKTQAEGLTAGQEEAPAALALDENNLPVSWSLQLASFKDPENALNLRASLRQSEFRSYIIQAETAEEGEVYRVFVGPMLQKSRLSAISKELESKFDLKGRIVRYRIEDDAGQLGG